MPIRWTKQEEKGKYGELDDLYVVRNLTISEIAKILRIGQTTVYDRLLRLCIKPQPNRKKRFLNRREVFLPKHSKELAELTGILLGDGHLSNNQVFVHLGLKELKYANYIIDLFERLFHVRPKISIRRAGHRDIYLGSIKVVKFFKKMGLVGNKVAAQVGIPDWIFKKDIYGKNFLKGFFDTDGSIYRLKYGWQISYCNRSLPLLVGTRNILLKLGYKPSKISIGRIYLTRKKDLNRFRKDIGSSNSTKNNVLHSLNLHGYGSG